MANYEPDIIRWYRNDVSNYIDRATKESLVPQIHSIQSHVEPMERYGVHIIQLIGGAKHILVTGGVHGDEPAGTLAALRLIKLLCIKHYYEGADPDFTFHIYPCMNPWGYEHNARHNEQDIDLNRGFKKEIEGEECKIFANHVRNFKFEFTIDFHEGSRNILWNGFTLDNNPDGAWLYESCHDVDKRMGRPMIEAVRSAGLPVNALTNVYDDVCHDGLITYPEDLKSADYAAQDSFDAFLWKNHTEQSFTSETNMDWQMEDRIRAHHLMFFKALEIARER